MEEKEKTWSVKTIAEIAIFAALGYVLDMLAPARYSLMVAH